MTGQARCCGSVGSANRLENQRSMTGWNRDSGIPEIYPKTELGEGLAQRGPAHRNDPLNRLANLVIRGRRPRRDANRQPAIRQPAFAPLLGGMSTDRAIADAPIVYGDTGCILNVIGRDFLVADGREVGRVARVVAADHDHEIERLGDELEHGVLPLLGRRTDRVEGAEMLPEGLGTPASRHAFGDFRRDGERFARQHRRLVGDADALQVAVGIEAWGHLARELLEKPLPRPPSPEVLPEHPSSFHITSNALFPTRDFVTLARVAFRLLFVVLSVE